MELFKFLAEAGEIDMHFSFLQKKSSETKRSRKWPAISPVLVYIGLLVLILVLQILWAVQMLRVADII